MICLKYFHLVKIFQEKKCDSVIDCADGSDESDCEFLVVNDSYIKEKLPLTDIQNAPVQVRFKYML